MTPECPVKTSGRDWEIHRADSALQLSIQRKIDGLPEIKASESAFETIILCLSLYQAAGVEVSIPDIDIVYRTPTRNAIPGPRPVVCKFTRRIAKEKVMNLRKDACKVTASSIG